MRNLRVLGTALTIHLNYDSFHQKLPFAITELQNFGVFKFELESRSKMKNSLLTPSLMALLFISCSPDEEVFVNPPEKTLLQDRLTLLYGDLDALKLPNSYDLGNIPSDPNNPLTEPKVILGKLLFHETGLAQNPTKSEGRGTYSCAACHHANAGFQSGMQQGIGEGGFGFGLIGESRTISSDYLPTEIDVQPILSPTILNTAYQDVMLWNGQFGGTKTNTGTENSWTEGTPKAVNHLGFEGLESQAIAGMGVHRLTCDKDLLDSMGYIPYFDAAFPDVDKTERYSATYAGLAIAAYERTVLATEAPFQQWLNGNNSAMTEDEMKGAILFFGKANCYACHNGPGLNSTTFHALGMLDFSEDQVFGVVDETIKRGRGGFTLNSEDDYKFKTPTLYNLKDVKFFGHGGSFTSVKEVIDYKNKGVVENSSIGTTNISPLFAPLGLTDEEMDQLTTFIENALHDPNLDRFAPTSLPSGNCFPVADNQSKTDMGCN